jgi:hypothetical protein
LDAQNGLTFTGHRPRFSPVKPRQHKLVAL